jgi:ABC-2 type transport system ATP-binding protein
VLREDLWAMFGRLRDNGITLLVSSHVMEEAARCDKVLLMRDGSLLAHDTPAGLRERTGATDLDQAFLRLVAGGGPAAPEPAGSRA